MLLLQSRDVEAVQALADSFALPTLTDWQKQILTTAFARVGMPYIWGGTSDGPETEFGVTSRGGYDCSGFVWRVYKLQLYPNEGTLASVLRDRTTFQMSGEVPPRSGSASRTSARRRDLLRRPRPRSQPAQVGHGDLRRERLVRPFLRLRSALAARRLVCEGVRLGPPAAAEAV
jgi:hypothetical protein